MQLIINNEEAMLNFGYQLARACNDVCIIYLSGELGAGKTTLVRGFLKALDHQGKVKSPTYTLVETYNLSEKKIFHFDLYRLKNPLELHFMGIEDYFNDKAIILLEWPERGENILPQPDLMCDIQILDEKRKITLNAISSVGKAILERFENPS